MTTVDLQDCPELDDLRSLPENQQFAAVLDYLAAKNARLNAIAAAILIGLGPGIAPHLVREAAVQRKRPVLQTRLLEIVEKLNAPLTINSFMDMGFMARQRNRRVREKAVRAICRLSPAGRTAPKPPDPDDNPSDFSNGETPA